MFEAQVISIASVVVMFEVIPLASVVVMFEVDRASISRQHCGDV